MTIFDILSTYRSDAPAALAAEVTERVRPLAQQHAATVALDSDEINRALAQKNTADRLVDIAVDIAVEAAPGLLTCGDSPDGRYRRAAWAVDAVRRVRAAWQAHGVSVDLSEEV